MSYRNYLIFSGDDYEEAAGICDCNGYASTVQEAKLFVVDKGGRSDWVQIVHAKTLTTVMIGRGIDIRSDDGEERIGVMYEWEECDKQHNHIITDQIKCSHCKKDLSALEKEPARSFSVIFPTIILRPRPLRFVLQTETILENGKSESVKCDDYFCDLKCLTQWCESKSKLASEKGKA